ncbi:MAG: glycosyltransferase [Alphaproteobacteria bacterium]
MKLSIPSLPRRCNDWELIIVDDGSTDSTTDIIKSYADPRIRLIQQKKAGPSAARWAGDAGGFSRLAEFFRCR